MTTCGLQDGITIEFPRSDVTVRPYQGDIRAERRNFSHADFELSKEEGELVRNFVEQREPAYIVFDETRGRRMFYPPDGLSFKYDLRENEKAELTLVDARKALQYGTINKIFGNTNLFEVVSYIHRNREDPFDVIKHFNFVGENLGRTERTAAFTPGSEALLPDMIGDPADRFVAQGASLVANLLEMEEQAKEYYAGFEFKDISPLQALQIVTDEFGVNSWVDVDGVLHIGIDGTRGQVMGTIAGDDGIVLKRYSITQSSNVTDSVGIRGPYMTLDNKEVAGVFELPGTGRQIQVLAEAELEGFEGSMMALEAEKRATNLDSLRKSAERILIQEVMEDTEGSFQVNAIASEKTNVLGRIDIGDKIIIDGSIREKCDENVVTGGFLITSVQHNFSTRRGWTITCDASRIPDPQNIRSKAVIYDPLKDETYESLRAFAEANA